MKPTPRYPRSHYTPEYEAELDAKRREARINRVIKEGRKLFDTDLDLTYYESQEDRDARRQAFMDELRAEHEGWPAKPRQPKAAAKLEEIKLPKRTKDGVYSHLEIKSSHPHIERVIVKPMSQAEIDFRANLRSELDGEADPTDEDSSQSRLEQLSAILRAGEESDQEDRFTTAQIEAVGRPVTKAVAEVKELPTGQTPVVPYVAEIPNDGSASYRAQAGELK